VLSTKVPADGLLERARAGRADSDRALLHTIVLGTLRWLLRVDHVIERVSKRSMSRIDSELRGTLRVAVYQLLFLDRVPSHAVVHEAVEEAKGRTHRGGASFVNAVLRKVAVRRDLGDWGIDGDLVKRLSIETSHPRFLVERWLARWGEAETRKILEANNRTKPTHLLAFSANGGREALRRDLEDEDVVTRESEISPLGLVVESGDVRKTNAFRTGRVYIQDEAAQAAALVPAPGSGERVFDAAAAPGGKSFALIAAEPTLKVVAADSGLLRLRTLHANVRRLGCEVPMVASSAVYPPFERAFDRVVVDYPCTGTGTFRKHPELKWRVSPGEIDRLAANALRFARGVAPLVRPGGLLIGISCSIEPEENEGWVERFLRDHDEFVRADIDVDGVNPLIAPFIRASGLWQLPPGGDHDGLTVNVLLRNCSSSAT